MKQCAKPWILMTNGSVYSVVGAFPAYLWMDACWFSDKPHGDILLVGLCIQLPLVLLSMCLVLTVCYFTFYFISTLFLSDASQRLFVFYAASSAYIIFLWGFALLPGLFLMPLGKEAGEGFLFLLWALPPLAGTIIAVYGWIISVCFAFFAFGISWFLKNRANALQNINEMFAKIGRCTGRFAFVCFICGFICAVLPDFLSRFFKKPY